MKNKYTILIPCLVLLLNFSFSQRVEQNDSVYDNLRTVVENASRSQQVVWVEDFTGLN